MKKNKIVQDLLQASKDGKTAEFFAETPEQIELFKNQLREEWTKLGLVEGVNFSIKEVSITSAVFDLYKQLIN